ncbi:cytoplasmic dynein 1 intermediate chain 1 isoform X2 [Etheostoma cragini]|uniref:cytoplasmic dynein 1 intermediate chain 1 isoform X2 n=1 Tax=Etheostoma cragini TaxID=417921 RepID=UPI00155E0220|nr:cytoplasmic dynein 1 intermediate chain 1 isoform X2 [Etheostoma cragini]
MSDKSDLKAELERKKQRLAQIRQEKKIKEEERKKKEVWKKSESQQKREATPEDSDLDRKRRETEALLQSIGISPEPSLVHSLQPLMLDSCYFHYLVPTPVSPSKSVSTPSETGSQDSTDGGAAGRFRSGFSKNKSQAQSSRTLQWDTDPSVLQLQADSEHGRRMQRLGASKITQVDFLPKEVVSYCKETQTPLTAHLSEEEEEEDEEMMEAKPGPESEQQDEDDNRENKEGSFPVLRELTEEERQQILHSSEFQSFFDCSIRVMERALAEDSNIFFDYGGRELEDKEGDLGSGSSLSFSRLFYDEHWSKHRVITCLDWSLQYPELLVASYNNNEDAPHEPDGVALVWNIKFKKATPEYIFHCQSPVVSVGFARFHPNLVVGGTYSGQIVLWDNRSHRRTPVQRTPLSAAAHTHPVYCVNVVGTQNANNLITVSTDGRMCSWSLDMLSQPQETMELVYNKSKPVAVTGMAFPTGDVNNYVVGSEEGTVYTASRHGSKAGICEMFEGHQGPVTGISCHSAVGTVDFSHLFITSSFDWTVKLWSTKQNKPLYSFEDNADYVYDVAWSPVHPAIFAAVDGMGRLDLWNLNNDTEVPTASVTIEGASALNRVRWSSGGKEVAVGDSEGRVWIYDTGELSVTHTDDWARFARTLMEIRANRADGEEEGPMELAS